MRKSRFSIDGTVLRWSSKKLGVEEMQMLIFIRVNKIYSESSVGVQHARQKHRVLVKMLK